MKRSLTVKNLLDEAPPFADAESRHWEPGIQGVTDGKALGTYLEHKFRTHLEPKYQFEAGSSARGIDFPALNVDMKVTRIAQPQSPCPHKEGRRKIHGVGYSLLLFVCDKTDDAIATACRRSDASCDLDAIHEAAGRIARTPQQGVLFPDDA